MSVLGKVIIITGANSGIGYQTALNLAARGAKVILACRNKDKGISARNRITAATKNPNVFFKHLDLSSLASVRSFAKDIITTQSHLDILINNAGVYGPSDKYTEDGIIEDLQVNHFGPFLLTLLLRKHLEMSRPSRIINVSSILHYYGYINIENMNKIRKSKLINYVNSKLCNILFTVEFARRFKNSGVVCNAVHPGMVETNISNNSNWFVKLVFRFCCWVCFRSLDEGVQTIVHLAVSKECEEISGFFFADFTPRYLLPISRNSRLASALWKLSENLVQYIPD